MTESVQIQTFLYHEVVDNPNDSGFQRNQALPYKHKVSEFKENIDIIVRNSELITTVDRISLHGNSRITLISFDDGGKSAMTSASYLEKHNLRGHFFVSTAFIGDEHFLKAEEIIDLHKRGHIIGSHSHSHPNVFKKLTYREMEYEWKKSKAILEKLLKTEVNSCSVPGGDSNPDTYASAIDCGFKYIFDSEPITRSRQMGNALILGRICPKAGTKYQEIENLARFKGMRKQYFVRELKKTIKNIIFPIYVRMYDKK